MTDGLITRIIGKINYRNTIKALGIILFLIGLLFYVAWSILYNTWSDPGLYSFCIVLIVFGLIVIFGSDLKDEN
ncbi:hypothetical protein [Caldiplasma sukawensis]